MINLSNISSLSILAVTCLGLVGCASAIKTPNQRIEVVTPGAEDSYCNIVTGQAIYQVRPPQTITVRNTHKKIHVNCFASPNRAKSVVYDAVIANEAYGNVATAGLGALYDAANGALFTYPDKIVVDFRSEQAQVVSLPAYSFDREVSGFSPQIEYMGPKTLESRTSYQRADRSGFVNERERRKDSVGFNQQNKNSAADSGYQSPYDSGSAPAYQSPYSPEPIFPGTTSF